MSCHHPIDARDLSTAEETYASLQFLRETIERTPEADLLGLAERMIDAIIDELSIRARHEQRNDECMSLSILAIDIQRYFGELERRRALAAS